jgi:DNA-binding sugar fermentation-stimulating protein
VNHHTGYLNADGSAFHINVTTKVKHYFLTEKCHLQFININTHCKNLIAKSILASKSL